MRILGIETSCDETAAAVVENGRAVLSSVVASSLKDHKRFGGIIPEIASRRQMELISAVVDSALKQAGPLTLADVDAIAVTRSPGLIGSLLVGLSYARALSFAAGKPLVEVDHIQAHLYANFLKTPQGDRPAPELPAVGLVVSGGHSSLFYLPDLRRFRLIGQTRDDAAGEAFDKVARILELGYPGGPAIDRLAKQGAGTAIRFKCAPLPDTYDFSFSGIKTAVLYYKQKHGRDTDFSTAQVAHAFQKSVVAVLAEKSIAACLKKKVRTLLVGGGVAANSALREQLSRECRTHDLDLFFPPIEYCLDNAAMIAGFGYQIHRSKISLSGKTKKHK